jgi:hypothetical protein
LAACAIIDETATARLQLRGSPHSVPLPGRVGRGKGRELEAGRNRRGGVDAWIDGWTYRWTDGRMNGVCRDSVTRGASRRCPSALLQYHTALRRAALSCAGSRCGQARAVYPRRRSSVGGRSGVVGVGGRACRMAPHMRVFLCDVTRLFTDDRVFVDAAGCRRWVDTQGCLFESWVVPVQTAEPAVRACFLRQRWCGRRLDLEPLDFPSSPAGPSET